MRELIEKCIGKDVPAWDEFIRLYEGLVCRSVRNKLGRMNAHWLVSEIKDIVQEIFITLWEKDKLSTLRDAKRLDRWLVKVSVNNTVNYCRKTFKRTERTSSLDKSLTPDAPCTLASVIPCNRLNTRRLVEAAELRSVIEKEMSKLTRRQRLALKLNVYGHKKQKDIAQIMSIPAGTAAVLVSRAKNQVRERMEKHYSTRR